jgi:Rrf2 family transcriptional regulator, iron-sulfur cluster assembly transcription factor
VGLQLTRGGEYGIRAMSYLARYEPGEICSLRDVGRDQEIPESFLAKIFQALVHAGLVVSHRGAHGGFTLARPCDHITVREVIEAVDGPISLNGCVVRPDECTRSHECAMHDVWGRAQQRMMDVLDDVTLADLAATPQVRRLDA